MAMPPGVRDARDVTSRHTSLTHIASPAVRTPRSHLRCKLTRQRVSNLRTPLPARADPTHPKREGSTLTPQEQLARSEVLGAVLHLRDP